MKGFSINRISMLLILGGMLLPNVLFAQSGPLTSEEASVIKGQSITLPLNIQSSSLSSYSGFQFDVEMPMGLTLKSAALGDGLPEFTIATSSLDSNPVRVIAYEGLGNGVSVTEGFLTLEIEADSNATLGEKDINLKNIIFSTEKGSDVKLENSTVSVTVNTIYVSSITIAYAEGVEGDLKVGESAVYTATVNPDNALDKSYTWSIEDSTVASIQPSSDNSEVTVNALKIGETTLKATANDGSNVVGIATIKVVATPISTVTISSEGDKTSLYPEDTLTLTANVNPDDATTPLTYKWESDNSEVATVSDETASVTLTAVKTGEANITVTVTNQAGEVKSTAFKVTVTDRPIESVTIKEGNTLDKYVGDEFELTYEITPVNATNPVITWSSDQPGVAKVEDGTVTALTLGEANITVTATNGAGSKTATIKINVVPTPATSVTITGDKHNLKVRETMTLTATVAPENATYKEVEWSSSDTTKATVSEDGTVTAVAIGEVTITATVKNNNPEVKSEYRITISDHVPGDANDNGEVTVADVVTIAYHIVGAEVDNFNEFNADVNGDGEIDVTDINQTVNIIMGNLQTVSLAFRPANSNGDKLVVGEVQGESAFGRRVFINLENSIDYSSLQADIVLPTGATVEGLRAGDRAARHSMAYKVGEDNILKVVLYSLNNKAFDRNDTPILEIELGNISESEPVKVENIIASDATCMKFTLTAESNGTTGVDNISADNDGFYRVYTIQGVNVMITEDVNALSRLPQGLYIINGKKVMLNK